MSICLSLGMPENKSNSSSLRQPFRYLKTVLQGPPEALPAQDKQILQPTFRHSLVSTSWYCTHCDFPAAVACEASDTLVGTNEELVSAGGLWYPDQGLCQKRKVVDPDQTLAHQQSFTSYILGSPMAGPCFSRRKRNENPPKVVYIISDPQPCQKWICVFVDPILST